MTCSNLPRLMIALLLLLSSSLVAVADTGEDQPTAKPRLIVITDIGTEPDDVQSLVRLLTYANEFEIEGLIAATSGHLRDRVHPEFIERRIDAYEDVLPNLRVHANGYPDAERLRSVLRAADPVYGMAGVGEGKHSDAARLIIDAVDRDDPRPVWVSIWGGAAPLAQALWTVRETRSPAEIEKFVAKLRVYSISDQDDTSPWARMVFPELFWITSSHAFGQYGLAAWRGISAPLPGADQSVVDNRWIERNVRSHGPLGAMYPLPMFIVEGDTPSYLYLVPNGLGYAERPDWGSWGGRWGQVADFLGLWTDVEDSAVGNDGQRHTGNTVTVWRWRRDFQNDFAARMDWSVEPHYSDANHPPQPVLNGEAGIAPVNVTACPGETVELSAAGSKDPDADKLSFNWMWYREVNGSYAPALELSETEGATTTLRVPGWTQPHSIPLPPAYDMHIVLSVVDDGEPALTRYRRAVIRVPTGGGRSDSGERCSAIALSHAAEPTDFVGSNDGIPGAWFSTEVTPLGELAEDPAARAVIEKYLPGIMEHATSGPARSMTLRAVQQFQPDISQELLNTIDSELARIPPPSGAQ